jgi:hypothetical protein
MSKRIVVRSSGDLLKSHVKGYSRKDGTYVQDHDDKRQKKAAAPAGGGGYSHPHVVGKATVTDPHATGPGDASVIQFAGTEYFSTSKKGKSFHDETPVREFESEDGHRVWMDDHGRVHADDISEVDRLRKKGEAVAGKPADGGGDQPASKTGDNAAGEAKATPGGPKPETAPDGADAGAGGQKKAKPKTRAESKNASDSGDGVDDASREKLYQQANAAYTKHFTDKVQPVEKAYRDGKASIDDLLAVRSESKKLMADADAEFDKLLKAAKGKKAPKGKGQGDLFKSAATGDSIDGRGPEHEDQQDDDDPGVAPKKKRKGDTLAKAFREGVRYILGTSRG